MRGFPGILLLLPLLRPARGQKGDGCGLTVLGPQSGTLASKNYPGTYPNNTRCQWRIKGAALALNFGDLDLEYSQNCSSGSLTVSSQGLSYGPYCGSIPQAERTLPENASDVTVLFVSGTHRSGRGFLLSYTSIHQRDLISCLSKGVHFSSPRLSVYCPAGCKDIAGDIWGHAAQGYRDTSVICKAALHAGAISDDLGGPVTFTKEKGITLYEASTANGLLSKTGSLSEKRLLFNKDCDEALDVAEFRASSSWREVDPSGYSVVWTAERASFFAPGAPRSWAAEGGSGGEWLEIDLGGRRNITGIVTWGSPNSRYHFHTQTYKVLSSRDGKTWKVYKANSRMDEKVFEGNTDSQQAASNNFFPPIVSRYLRIEPQSWNLRVALKVKVLGCQATRATNERPQVYTFPSEVPHVTRAPPMHSTVSSIEIQLEGTVYNFPREIPSVTSAPPVHSTVPSVEIHPEGADQILTLALILVGLVFFTTGLILFGILCYKKRKKTADGHSGCFRGYRKPQSSKVCCRPNLHPSDSELISYSDEGSPGGTRSPEYTEPNVLPVGARGQKVPSTFKPAQDEGYTLPLVVNHYDVPGRNHEYAEPLPAEPEYATPFTDQALASVVRRNICIVKVIPPAQGMRAPLPGSIPPGQYDAPAPRRTVEVEDQTPGMRVGALEGHSKAGAVCDPVSLERNLTGRGGACRELPPVPWGHSQTRDSLPHVYHEPL